MHLKEGREIVRVVAGWLHCCHKIRNNAENCGVGGALGDSPHWIYMYNKEYHIISATDIYNSVWLRDSLNLY